jgi:hypothetical protein
VASVSWQKRNARARALGFRNYYDYRAHGYGQSRERLTGEALAKLRGHRSAADLEGLLRRGRVATMIQEPIGERDPQGRYGSVKITVQLANGDQRSFTLRGRQLRARQLDPLRQAAIAGGVDVYLNPSLDVIGLRHSDVSDLEEAA